jgi:ATP phosphoribosyltransferase
MSDDALVIAIPSKGRLEEEARRVFGEARLAINRPGGERSYSGSIKGQPQVQVRFYPASEIARELIMGSIDLGVTGSDLIHEAAEAGADNVIFAKALDFGRADVVVAVPDAWIDVTHMSDLADVASDFRLRHGRWLRIATKYTYLTRKFFADWGIAEYRLVESVGATEAAPASGAADLIVDITSSGETLSANALRVLEDGTIMKSEANLIVSKASAWTPMKKAQLEALLSMMGGIPPGTSTQL